MEREEKWLYLECYSGISGDMTVGALLDLGASREVLEKALGSLRVDGYHLHFGRKQKCGIDAYDFDVHLEDDGHVHGDGHVHEDGHVHGDGHTHSHDHVHGDDHHHAHVHRNIHDIFAIIDRLEAGEQVREMARKIFTIVAKAESKAHGIPVEEVHFHEVGAVDSIVDIISTAVCLDNLGIKKVVVSSLAEGRGYVRCQHGVMPVPVPATANIVADAGLELKLTDNDGEMVTPTGAAIAAALRTAKELPEHYTIDKIGVGAGNKDFKNANILRAMIIRPIGEKAEDGKIRQEEHIENTEHTEEKGQLWVLESNLDDCTGEALGFVMEVLLEEGAKDVWYTPAYMKKNRPAYVLHVLCTEDLRSALEAAVFAHTTTIGIRRYPVERTCMDRENREITSRYGQAEVKICRREGKTFCYPEYESVKKICREQKLEFTEVYHGIKEDAAVTDD